MAEESGRTRYHHGFYAAMKVEYDLAGAPVSYEQEKGLFAKGVMPVTSFPVIYAYCYTNDGAPSVNTDDQQGAYIAVRHLQDIGLGLLWSKKDAWWVRADYAWKLGSEKPITDTSHSNGHFWIQGGFYF